MAKNRRSFLKKSVGIGALATIGGGLTSPTSYGTETKLSLIKGKKIKIDPSPEAMIFKPLDLITVNGIPGGTITVMDRHGKVYIREKAEGSFSFKAGGL